MLVDTDATVRVEARFKNARLFNAIAEYSVPLTEGAQAMALNLFGPVLAFCKLHGFNYTDLGRLLNLRIGPYVRRRGKGGVKVVQVRPLCQKLADMFGVDVDYLFPPELYERTWPVLAVDIPHARMLSLTSVPSRLLALVPPAQEDEATRNKLRTVLQTEVDTLTKRESQVMRLLYGLNNDKDAHDELTRTDVAARLFITPERIRQIQAKALRKLRHPNRSKKLKGFLKE